jgi:hypothetical protein
LSVAFEGVGVLSSQTNMVSILWGWIMEGCC